MTNDNPEFALTSVGSQAARPVLTGAAASGRLDGVLFALTVRQTYRNTGNQSLEVVYTFPLPSQAVLLGFASELNGHRMDGRVVSKQDAECTYERALTDGNAPVLLEALADGLHTANIGNLEPGDEIVLEVQFAQLLVFEHGRLRLSIPATIAPRYGHAESSGLQPQQVPAVSAAAYPLALSVLVTGSLAAGAVECPTHRFSRQLLADGLRLDLLPGAWLDRDAVITVTPANGRPSLLVKAHDLRSISAPVVMMASFQPPVSAPRDGIALKLLVDCSGSMGGDSIQSACTALRQVVAGLTGRDRISLSRFGTGVDHLLAPSVCSPATVRQLARLIDTVDADLGGTEMEQALRAVFALDNAGPAGADVLLITDGEIWQARELVAAAKACAHRVFVIGVGASPAEGVLRALAEATGGACEFATPGEALQAAAQRMLRRIRQQPWQQVRVDWGTTTAWQGAAPTAVFGGDTVLAFAGLRSSLDAAPVRLLASDAHGRTTEIARAESSAGCPGDSLPRMAAAHRAATAIGPASLALALDYQLMGSQTHCILVHPRADADKATEQAEIHRVLSILAAGWAVSSTVIAPMTRPYSICEDSFASPAVWRSARARAAGKVAALDNDGLNQIGLPAYLGENDLDPVVTSLRALALAVVDHLRHGGQVEGLAAHCASPPLHPDVRQALAHEQGTVVDPGFAMLALAHWVAIRGMAVDLHAAVATLQPHLSGVHAALLARWMALFDDLLGHCVSASGSTSRRQRSGGLLSRAET